MLRSQIRKYFSVLPNSRLRRGAGVAEGFVGSKGVVGFVESFTDIKIGGRSYKVHEDLSGPHGAAVLLSDLDKIGQELIDRLQRLYISGSELEQVRPEFRPIVVEGIRQLTSRFASANLEENLPSRSGGDTSFVVDKGKVFAMCLRDPKKEDRLDSNGNALTFVLIHEMAHLFTTTFGHDELFWNNFAFLLSEAVRAGIYTSTDYSKVSMPYCGIDISYSPLFDEKVTPYRA